MKLKPISSIRDLRNGLMFLPGCLLFLVGGSLVAQDEWKPVQGGMITKWGNDVKSDEVWSEYPRPQLVREDWTNLNGLWDYAITGRNVKVPSEWDGQILVPFAPEAALSGVGRLLEPDQTLWYRRDFQLDSEKRTILHFEAVDYETTVWVNGQEVGQHKGGHTPFNFDITEALHAGDNELVVRVYDETEGFQLHGKQKLEPGGIWYTRVSGIWQSVWIEQVPDEYINDLDFTCNLAEETLKVEAKLSGARSLGGKLRVKALFDGSEVARGEGTEVVMLKLPGAKLWSPDAPNLYDLEVELVNAAGEVIDQVESYAAMREFGKVRDANGHFRFTLNGDVIFHWGPLDQGWWPDGLLTPPSDEAMRSDIVFLKEAGFNMIRKHIKVEPRRYYAHCDRIGMLMWQDQVSMGYGPETKPLGSNPRWTRLARNPEEGKWPTAAHEQFVAEYKRMVDHLEDQACVAVWGPFNEAWGQHRTMEVGRMAVGYDRTRPVNIASGGNFWPIGEIADEHAYPDPTFPLGDKRFGDYIKVVGEFGGHAWPVEGHLWRKDRANWGYGGIPESLDEWKRRYEKSINRLIELRKNGVAAGVYTQTSDVEVEINGLLTYDRKQKIDPAWLRKLSERLLDTPDVVQIKVLLATSDTRNQDWRYVFSKPSGNWQSANFDDSEWKKGPGGFGTRLTPNTRIGTEWDSGEIWIRREFFLDNPAEGSPMVRVFHDEDVMVYLNGEKVVELPGYTMKYVDVPLNAPHMLKVGRNVLSIYCRQTDGGQFIDAGLIDEIPQSVVVRSN